MDKSSISTAIKYGKLLFKHGKPVVKWLVISGVIAFTFKWLWDIEQKLLHLERDIYYNLPEHDE
jgi:hypothetical protein